LFPNLFLKYNKGRSTLQQLLVFLDFIYSNSSEQVDVIQRDLDSATLWSEGWDVYFNQTKSIYLRINAKAITEYRIAGTNIVTKSVYKDLGIVMSDDLSWNQHYEKIILKSLQNAGATLAQFQPVSIWRTLYLR